MISDLKQYPENKCVKGAVESVPSHWNVRRMKYILREINERSRDGKEQLLRVSQYTGVTERRQKDSLHEPDTRAESLIGYKCVEKNDLVINIMSAWNGSLGVSRFPGIVSPAYCVYRFNHGLEPWYFHYLLRSPAFKSHIKTVSTGVVESRLRLYTDNLNRINTPVPPLDEQLSIVHFLEWITARLERIIRAKKKVIALLNEQKQAVIHHAVTRGLDSTVPLKHSGIPWLGDVPQHWDVAPMKRVCTLIRDGTHLPPQRTDKGVPLLSVRNIIDGKFVRRADDSYISEENYKILVKSFDVRQNDVLLAIVGVTLGKVAVVGVMEPFHVQRSLAVFRPKKEALYYNFLELFLRSPQLQQHLWQSVAFSAQPGIYLGFISNIPVPMPPMAEQLYIYRYYKSDIIPIDIAINDIEREIELLREHRMRLIADVVTGRLDVREAAARLPKTTLPSKGIDDELSMNDSPSDQELDDEEAAA